MKDLLQTHSASYAQSLRLELETEGIEAVLLDEQAPMYMSFAGKIRVAVVHDGDFERAMQVVRNFEASRASAAVPASWRWQRPGLVAGCLGFVLLMVAAYVVEENVPRELVYALFAAAAGLMATGAVLVFVGLRQDRQRPG